MKKVKILSMLLSACLLFQTTFATGIMTASAAEESAGTETTALANPYEVCKSLYNFRVVGSPVVGETLRVEYECSDPNMDTSTLNFRWIPMEKVNLAVNDSKSSSKNPVIQDGGAEFKIPETAVTIKNEEISMIGKYVSVSVTGIPNAGDKEFIAYAAGPIMAETPAVPVASSVTFYNVDENNRSGGVGVGDTLEAYYFYSGTNQEGTSRYQWYYADKADGDYQPIPNATEKTYTVQKEYYKKYLKLGVTPVDAADTAGTEALSESVPQVGNAAYRAFVSAPTDICAINPRLMNSLSYIVDGMDKNGRLNPWTWTNNSPDTCSVLIDLRRPVRINSSRIKLENSLFYSISCYDEASSTWKTLVEKAEPKKEPEKSFDPIVTRFVRIEFEINQKNGARLFEAAIFEAQDEAPTIALNGDSEVNLSVGQSYEELGATATDPEDGDLAVNIDGTVNTEQAGDYTLTYTAVDSFGHRVSVTRIVHVAPAAVNPSNTYQSIYNFRLVGSPVVGEKMRVEYECSDPNMDTSKLNFRWVPMTAVNSAVNDSGSSRLESSTVIQNGGAEFTIPETATAIDGKTEIKMVGKYISVSVKGIPNAGDKEFIAYAAGPVLAEAPEVPVASSVTFYNVDENNRSGGVGVGDTLEAYYFYSGKKEEGTSLYQWYYADKADGSYQPIPNATEKTYKVQKEYYKKYLKLGVTPVDAANGKGKEALSESVPQVGNAAYRAFVSAPADICAINPRLMNSLSYIVDGTDKGGKLNTWDSETHSLLIDLRRPVRIDSSRIKLDNSLYYSISCYDEASSTWKTLVEKAEPKAKPEAGFKPTVTRFVKIEFEGKQKNGARFYEAAIFEAQDEEPTIALNGDSEVNLIVGQQYEELGAAATDPEDGDLAVNIDGTVNVEQAGDYTLTYTAADSFGNQVSVTRLVHVATGFRTEGDEMFGIVPDVSTGQNPKNLTDGNQYTKFTGSAASVSMKFDLGAAKAISHLMLQSAKQNIKSVLIEGSNDGTGWNKLYQGALLSAAAEESEIWSGDCSFGASEVRYAKVTLEFTDSKFELYSMELSLDDQGKVLGDKEALKLDCDLNNVTTNIGLPQKGAYGTNISWQSSDSSVIDEKGTIKRNKDSDKTVNLTATITFGEFSDTKSFALTVKKADSSGSGSGGTGFSGGGGSGSGSRYFSGGKVAIDSGYLPAPTPLPTFPPEAVLNGDFLDIGGHWAEEYIVTLKKKDIVSGREANLFDPEGSITREEFVKMVLGAFGLKKEGAKCDFADVPQDAWFYPYVAAAVEHGIIHGVSDTEFGAGRLISRQDMAVIASRAVKAANRAANGEKEISFADMDAVAEYALDAVNALAKAGIFNGDETGSFRPNANATRAETAKIACMLTELPSAGNNGSTTDDNKPQQNLEKLSAPYAYQYAQFFLNSTPRRQFSGADSQKWIDGAKPYMDLSEDALVTKITADTLAMGDWTKHPDFELAAAQMSMLYRNTGDEKYARYAILILGTQAENFDKVPVSTNVKTMISEYNPFTYNNIYDSSSWDVLKKEKGKDYRAEVEKVFEKLVLTMADAEGIDHVSNLAGYGYRLAAAISVTMDRPDLVRKVIKMLDQGFGRGTWLADGMWREGSVSYGDQMRGFCGEAAKVISFYTDPSDYVDGELGLSLKRTDLMAEKRWPVIGEYDKLTAACYYPNGERIAFNDTHPTKPWDTSVDKPMQEKYLKNVEIGQYGFFSLTTGNTTDAQTSTLLFKPWMGGGSGHTHENFLSMTLFAGGTEVLPDQGYPFNASGTNRYFHMGPITHNQSWITTPTTLTTSNNLSQAQLLKYDDGLKNGRQVEVVEASQLRDKSENIEIKRRMLVNIKTGESTSYTFDMQRLKGGTAHENILRASENEDCTLTTDETLKLQDKKMKLNEYVNYLHGNGGIAVTDGGDRVNVEKVGSGSQDFNFTWTGDKSGTAVNMFIKGEQGVNIAFSKFSTLRRTLESNETQKTLKDNFPNWHFYQRRDVTPSDVTQFSGVYEGVRKEQEPKVISAEWTDIDEENHMCAVTKVTGKDFIDYIYVSDDLLDREFEGISFSGELAILRLQNGNPVWGYVYSDGSVTYNGFSVQGNQRQEFTVSQTANEYIDGSTENKLVLDTEVQSANDLQGRWIVECFSDGSSCANKITAANEKTVTLSNLPGYTVTDEGAEFLFYMNHMDPTTGAGTRDDTFPARVAKGQVRAYVDIPVFKEN